MLNSRIWCFLCLLSSLQGFNFNPDYQCSVSSKIDHLQLKFAPLSLIFFLTVDDNLENQMVLINLFTFGEFQNKAVIFFLENNSSMTSQLSLNLGIFRTVNYIIANIYLGGSMDREVNFYF